MPLLACSCVWRVVPRLTGPCCLSVQMEGDKTRRITEDEKLLLTHIQEASRSQDQDGSAKGKGARLKKKAKAPNPLSVLKPKKAPESGGQAREGEPVKKRRRRRKEKGEPLPSSIV
jgi:hypothetical protein